MHEIICCLFSGDKGNVLKIWNVEKRHAGIYQCFATNPIGSDYGAAMVNVAPKEVKFEKEGKLSVCLK